MRSPKKKKKKKKKNNNKKNKNKKKQQQKNEVELGALSNSMKKNEVALEIRDGNEALRYSDKKCALIIFRLHYVFLTSSSSSWYVIVLGIFLFLEMTNKNPNMSHVVTAKGFETLEEHMHTTKSNHIKWVNSQPNQKP